MIPLKVTLWWDNLNFETIRTYSQFIRENDHFLTIADGGYTRHFNKSYLRKIEVLEEQGHHAE